VLFATTSLVVAITVAGLGISGWRAGSLDNRVEWVFWAGAIVGAVAVGLLGWASVSTRPPSGVLRVAMALFLLAPAFCMVAVFGDYWI
jgi:hypothetical protein